MELREAWRLTVAFVRGVLIGVAWECASMGVLIIASVVEHLLGTITMSVVFVGIAGCAFAVAKQVELARPLLSILLFRLSAQVAMTIGTVSVRACCERLFFLYAPR